MVLATTLSQSDSRETSWRRPMAFEPSVAATFCTPSWRTSERTTFAPSLIAVSASAFPIPLAAPVTRMTLSCSLPITFLLPWFAPACAESERPTGRCDLIILLEHDHKPCSRLLHHPGS